VALDTSSLPPLAIYLTALAVLFISAHYGWMVGRIGLGPVVLAAVYAIGTLAVRERQAAAAL
jgi:hypothetical protein